MALQDRRGPFYQQIHQKITTNTATKNSKEALDWFVQLVRNARSRKFSMDTEPMPGLGDPDKFVAKIKRVTRFEVGTMYFFKYDPKHKKTLPYYDNFPMIFPIEIYPDGMLGINLHYIPISYRVQLMNALVTIATNKTFDADTKLKISYALIKSTKKFRWAKPCIKRYLSTHIRSKFIPVPASEWSTAVFMPLAVWQKAPETKIFQDSIDFLKGKKK